MLVAQYDTEILHVYPTKQCAYASVVTRHVEAKAFREQGDGSEEQTEVKRAAKRVPILIWCRSEAEHEERGRVVTTVFMTAASLSLAGTSTLEERWQGRVDEELRHPSGPTG